MKVRMLRSVLYENKVFELGKEYEIDDTTANRWIKHDIAISTEGVSEKEEIFENVEEKATRKRKKK